MEPPVEVTGGPFDIKVSRKGKTISLTVTRDSDIVTQIDFNAERIGDVIQALIEARG